VAARTTTPLVAPLLETAAVTAVEALGVLVVLALAGTRATARRSPVRLTVMVLLLEVAAAAVAVPREASAVF
jgi:hypothetical protein